MIYKNLSKYITVFILFLAIFISWHAMHVGLLGTDDPYYHAKHGYLMAQSGNFTLIEPWVPFHFLTYAPTDLWWLYHVAAAIFIKFFGIIWGAKIFSAVCAALVFAVFYFILKQLKIFYPFVWTFLLFISSSTFTVRLLMERPFVLAIVFLPLCFYLIYQKKYWALAFVLALYALTYELAPFALFLAAVFLAVDWHLSRKIDLRPLIFSLGGLTAGILLHPRALNYIYGAYIAFIEVLYLKFAGVNLNIGTEIQSHSISDFLNCNVIILTFYVIAVALFVKMFLAKESNRLQLSLFLISFVWFCVAMIVPRGAEYWLPFGYLFAAVTFYQVSQSRDWEIARELIKQKTKAGIVLFFIYSVIFVFSGYNLFTVFTVLRERNQNDADGYYQEANDWLIKNTLQNSVVFYPIWSMFPQMFFYNDHNRYLTAFDPTFLYEYNHEIYYTWANIAYHGAYCPHEWPCLELTPRQELRGVKFALKNILGADIAVIPNKPDWWIYKVFTNMKGDFTKVYKNKELVIFKLIN